MNLSSCTFVVIATDENTFYKSTILNRDGLINLQGMSNLWLSWIRRAVFMCSGLPNSSMYRQHFSKQITMLTGKEILDLNPDGFHYTRLIQGKPHEKVIYGWVKLSEKGLQALKQLGLTKHDLPSNISPD